MKSGGRKWERERGLSIREDHLPLQRSPSSYLLGRKCPVNLEHGLSQFQGRWSSSVHQQWAAYHSRREATTEDQRAG